MKSKNILKIGFVIATVAAYCTWKWAMKDELKGKRLLTLPCVDATVQQTATFRDQMWLCEIDGWVKVEKSEMGLK